MNTFILTIILLDPAGHQAPPVVYPPMTQARCEAFKRVELKALSILPRGYTLVSAKCEGVMP